MLKKFVNKYFHLYECPAAQQYFEGGEHKWFVRTKFMTLTLTQYQSNIFNFKIEWVIHDKTYLTKHTGYKTKLSIKITVLDMKDIYESSYDVSLVPKGGKAKQYSHFSLYFSHVRLIYRKHTHPLVITMKDGWKELAELRVPLVSDLKFSFHTADWLDQKGKCCYKDRLADLYLNEIISQEFFDYARDNMHDYCLIPY